VHVLDKPEVMNSGKEDWDEPASPEATAGKPAKQPELSSIRVVAASTTPQVARAQRNGSMDAVSVAAKSMQSDAPACNTCGHITVRSGTCYKCLNCGNSMGCS